MTIKTIDELDIVSNQNLSVEMFLIRLMYLKDFKKKEFEELEIKNYNHQKKTSINTSTVDQIKNISQQDKSVPKTKTEKAKSDLSLSSFDELISLCDRKKEIKLKYELINNINLVSFSECRIEIGFNENLNKDFIKDLSNKLFEWTDKRWIISLSKQKGAISKKQEATINKNKIFDEAKKGEIYKKVLEIFPDAELTDITLNENKDD